MKVYKKVLGIVLAILLIVSTPCMSFANNTKNSYNIEKYEEYHDQINFEDLMMFVVNKSAIVVKVDPTISFFKKSKETKGKI